MVGRGTSLNPHLEKPRCGAPVSVVRDDGEDGEESGSICRRARCGPPAISLTAGWATDPDGFSGGPSGSGCFFAGIGGCVGISTSGDVAGQIGVGIGGKGAVVGYGFDPVDTIGLGMAKGEPADPLATRVGDVYMEDPQMWIPQN